MKNNVLLALTVLGSLYTSYAQTSYNNSNGVLNRLTVEASYGYNMALLPKGNIEVADYNGFKTFQVGLRLAIDEKWGVRGTFMNSSFQHNDFSDSGISINKLVAEGTYDFLDKSVSPSFQLMGHAGLGIGFIKSESLNGTDTAGVFQLGVTPEYKATDRLGIFLDLTYIMNLSQNYGFNGLSIDKSSGSFFVPSLGVSFQLTN